MARFIETENLPAPTEVDGKTIGGVAILTWSLSNGHLMAMLSNATLLEPDAYKLLDRYLRTAFMYGELLFYVFNLPCCTTSLS